MPLGIAAMPALHVVDEAVDLGCAYAGSMESLAANAPARFVNLSSVRGGRPDDLEIQYKNRFEHQFSTLRPKNTFDLVLGFAERQARLEERKDGIEELMARAREARDARDFEAAARHYRLAAYDLQTPIDDSPFSKPMYMHLVSEEDGETKPVGPRLLTEAILESASLSGEGYAVQNVHQLEYLLAHPPAGGFTEADEIRARILMAKSIAAYASKAIHSKIDSLEQAHSLLHEIFYSIDPKKDLEHKELHLFAGTSLVELTAKLFYFASQRGDRKAGDKKSAKDSIEDDGTSEMPGTYVSALQKYLNRLQRVHCPPDVDARIKQIREGTDDDGLIDKLNADRNLIASYRAAIARLFASEEHWYSALIMARTLTSHPLDGTPAARALLKADVFNRFHDGLQFLEPEEIPGSQKDGSFGRWLSQVLHNAKSGSFMESGVVGSAGLLMGLLGDKIASGGEHGLVAATICAGGAYLLNLIRNGVQSEQAKVAWDLGILEREGKEIRRDLLDFAIKTAKSGAWIVPAAFFAFAPDIVSNLMHTQSLFGSEYLNQFGDLFSGIGSSAHSLAGLVEPQGAAAAIEALKETVAGISDIGLGEVGGGALGLYAAAAGTFFALNIFSASFRKKTEKTWWPVALMPGAMFCAAYLGLAIQHAGCDDTWLDRFFRTIPIAIGGVLVMLTSGISTFARKKKQDEKESIWTSLRNSFDPRKNDYSLPLIMIITNGATSAIGGNVQRSFQNPENTVDLMTRGIAMPIGLLLITLGLSGVIKGKVPLKARIDEALQDTEGMGFPTRAYEVFMSAASAVFTSAYSENRLFRTLIYDPPGAIARFALTWDSVTGASVQKAIDLIMGDGASTTTWNETSNTRWERAALLQALHDLSDEMQRINDELDEGKITTEQAAERTYETMKEMRVKLKISAQSMHPTHLAMDHKRYVDSFWPLASITRAFRHPKFTHRVNTHFYQDVYQLLLDSHTDLQDESELKAKEGDKASAGAENNQNKRDSRLRISEEEFETLLTLVRVESAKSVSHDRIRPMVETLILARGSERFGSRIEAFLAANPWIVNVLNIDVGELERMRGSSFVANMTVKASRFLSNRFPKISRALRKAGDFMKKKFPDFHYYLERRKPKMDSGRHPIRRIDHKRFRFAIKTQFKKYERRIRSDRRQPDETELMAELFDIAPFDTTAPDASMKPVEVASPPHRGTTPDDIETMNSVLGEYKNVKFL